MINMKSETLCLSEGAKVIKEESANFSSNLIGQ